nr:phage antirepressor KilAC domain-containing protein [Clostridium beijerinckii]
MYATDELLDNPDLLIAAATKLKEERAARLEAEKKVKVLEPKGEFYDDVAGSKDSIEMGHVAKVLGIRGIGRNNLFALLRDKKVLDRNNIPYQQYVDCGYFRVLEQKYTVPNGETKINIKTMVFQKGIDFIRKKIKEP